MKKLFFILILLLGGVLFAQQTDAQKKLLKRAKENLNLLSTNLEKGFIEAKEIEEEAKKINAKEAELVAIRNQCNYYKKRNNDFKNMMTTADLLFQKAKSYKMPIYQAMAKNILFDAYAFSGLLEKAFQELNTGMDILEQNYKEDSISITTKSDLFVSYSNYYYLINSDYKNQLRYIKLSGKGIEKLPEGKNKQKSLYIYYANLAEVYMDANELDSAKYYAKFSQSIKADCNCVDIEAKNLSVLGEVEMKKTNYHKAVSYFKEAEKIKGYKVHLNIENLYDNIIQAYKKSGKEDSVRLYKAKKDSLNLSIAENQNKSLSNLLKHKQDNKPGWYFYMLILFLIAMTILVIIVVRKNRILIRQEENSRKYLEEYSENPNGEDYSKLLEALKEKDPAFIFYFDEIFPDFSSKLMKIQPKLSSSEIEFCTLLKLKIPTKEIAQYKFIEPATVRNKKYLIKKKLNIPNNMDIYKWFDEP